MFFHVPNRIRISLKEVFKKEDIKAEFGLCLSGPCPTPVFYNRVFNRIGDSWDWIPVTLGIRCMKQSILIQKTSRYSRKLQDFRDLPSTTPQAVDKCPHPAWPFSNSSSFGVFFLVLPLLGIDSESIHILKPQRISHYLFFHSHPKQTSMKEVRYPCT